MKEKPQGMGLNNRSRIADKGLQVGGYLGVIILTITLLYLLGVAKDAYAQFNQPNKIISHKHIQLNITLDGQPLQIPNGIGIRQAGFEDFLLYGDHSLDQYGMKGMSPLHTHDDSGLIHVESNTERDFTLGDFLSIWRGLDVNDKTVKAFTNDKPITDFGSIILNDGEKIKLDIVT